MNSREVAVNFSRSVSIDTGQRSRLWGIRWTAWFDEFLSHGGTEARRIRIQIPVDDRTVDHDGPYRILIHLRVFVPPCEPAPFIETEL
jgi:hypothetical protein